MTEKTGLNNILAREKVRGEGTLKDFCEEVGKQRKECEERGYHRFSEEPESETSVMICYGCDLWFDKAFAESIEMKYRVEPLY